MFAQARSNPEGLFNVTRVCGLSGNLLGQDLADAGHQILLLATDGQCLERWDSEANHQRIEYDALRRLVTVFETRSGAAEQVRERIIFADPTEQAAECNQAGKVIRHDDTAGTLRVGSYSLAGTIMEQTRHYLQSLEPCNWPEPLSERDALLESHGGYTSRWRYDACGQVFGQTDAMGNTRRIRVDVAGQFQQLQLCLATGECQPIVEGVDYGVDGQVLNERLANGVGSQFDYEPQTGHVLRLRVTRGTGTVLQDLRYEYDPVGNITAVEDGVQAVGHFRNQRVEARDIFAYDTLNRLVFARGREACNAVYGPRLPPMQALSDPNNRVNYEQRFEYDEAGNMLTLVHAGAQNFTQRKAVARGSNRSLEQQAGKPLPTQAQIAAAFDRNGNRCEPLPGQQLLWDGRNQLYQFDTVVRQDAGNDCETYIYSAAGERCRKVGFSKAARLTHCREVRYLPGLELRTNSATGEVLQVIDGGSGSAAVRLLHWQAGRPPAISNNQQRYSISDRLGSRCLELDGQGALISHEGYYAYGGSAWLAGRNVVEVSYKTIRYSGQERDVSGLYYYGRRYYMPWLQCWASADPSGTLDGLNLYTMVQGNPTTNRDSQGLLTVGETGRAAMAAFTRGVAAEAAGETAAALLVYGLEQVPFTPANNRALTAAGALSGAIQGGGASALLTFRLTANRPRWQRWGATVAAGLGGAATGAMASIAGYLQGTDEQEPVNNEAAIGQIGILVASIIREVVRLGILEVGPDITGPSTESLRGTLMNAGAYGGILTLSGLSTGEVENRWVMLPIFALEEGLDNASETITSGRTGMYDPGAGMRRGIHLPALRDIIIGSLNEGATGSLAHLSSTMTPDGGRYWAVLNRVPGLIRDLGPWMNNVALPGSSYTVSQQDGSNRRRWGRRARNQEASTGIELRNISPRSSSQ
ncbi:MAG: RHS repeat-associated core domain-containing protein [Pseudomonas sp.]